ncbi:MAG: hypothetical protein VX112_01145 [Pseudomonadota bacterium]|nr:hypothetical protein [Pseudomonadota bacterium]
MFYFKNQIDISGSFSLDINVACSGFFSTLSLGNDRIVHHDDHCYLIARVDAVSRVADWKDRSTAVLFGDGAACVLLERSIQTTIQRSFLLPMLWMQRLV